MACPRALQEPKEYLRSRHIQTRDSIRDAAPRGLSGANPRALQGARPWGRSGKPCASKTRRARRIKTKKRRLGGPLFCEEVVCKRPAPRARREITLFTGAWSVLSCLYTCLTVCLYKAVRSARGVCPRISRTRSALSHCRGDLLLYTLRKNHARAKAATRHFYFNQTSRQTIINIDCIQHSRGYDLLYCIYIYIQYSICGRVRGDPRSHRHHVRPVCI